MAANPSFRIKLLPSAGDGKLYAPECQAAVRAFFQQLRDAGVIAHPVAFTRGARVHARALSGILRSGDSQFEHAAGVHERTFYSWAPTAVVKALQPCTP